MPLTQGGLIVDTERPEMDKSWRGLYSGSYGSLGNQYTLNGYMYIIHTIDIKWLPGLIGDPERPEMARSGRISYSGSYGSMGT